MHLLIFSPYYPPHTGGLESHSDEFNRHLAKTGARITIFTPRLPAEGLSQEMRYGTVQILRFPAFELIPNYPLPKFWKKEFWDLWNQCREEQYTLVLSRTRFFFTSLMALYFARRSRLPWVHIEHGSDFAQFNSSFKTALGKLYDLVFGAWVLRHSQKNIANSRASAEFVAKLSGRNDCTVIYRGIEKDIVESITPHPYFEQHFPGKVVIGFIGRLIDGKGVIDLLKAFVQLASPTSICCIIGDGPEREKIESFIKMHQISDKVVLLGEKPFPEAMALLKGFDIFVNPSYTEGIPTAVIEAALSRKAIIATNVGGTPEIITGKGDGFLIAPHDVSDLKVKLTLLLEDVVLRNSCGQNAYARVKDKFSWDQSVKKYLDIFNTLLVK